jgi:predicted phosphodiesterase
VSDEGFVMRVAALYDVHGNLPALEAVLHEVRQAGVDRVVVGGDVIPGPMPYETLSCLLELDLPVQFIHGNGELAVLAQMRASDDPGTVTYWGTRTGAPPREPLRRALRWTAQQFPPGYEQLFSSWPRTLRLEIGELGEVLFCHGTPRSELECFTRLTPEDRLLPVFEEVTADVVICGHTHMQFDRTVGRTRIVNAGSLGMPFQHPPGAYWLLIGPGVQLRHTAYDLANAAGRIRQTEYPQADEFAAHNVLQPPSEAQMLEAITAVSFQ